MPEDDQKRHRSGQEPHPSRRRGRSRRIDELLLFEFDVNRRHWTNTLSQNSKAVYNQYSTDLDNL